MHTKTNLQLKAADLFKYAWPFSGHQALKVYVIWNINPANIYLFKINNRNTKK